jgi:DNA polymerase-4
MWPRIIVHADMDAFYAAVEIHDDPSLRGRPLLIGGTGPRSVVATASYEARRFGIHSAMAMATAVRRCPQAIIRPPRMARYVEVSRQIMAVFRTFSPMIQPLSIDEAFLDCTLTGPDWPGPHELGRALKDAVRQATGGLTVSVGIAVNKFVAKVASEYQKPDGLTVVGPGEAVAFLAPQAVSRLWGAGPKTSARLEALGLKTIGDVARADVLLLSAHFGRAGRHFHHLAQAEDDRPVHEDRTIKSVSVERTLVEDIGLEAIDPHLERMAAEVSKRLKSKGILAGGVRVKLKTRRFVVVSRQASLEVASDASEVLLAVARRLLPEFELAEPVRLVGLGAFALESAEEPRQLRLPL